MFWSKRRDERIAEGRRGIFGPEWYTDICNGYKDKLREVEEEIKSRGK